MTKDEIKAYAREMVELAKIDGPDPTSCELRTRIVQQVVAVCGMPFESDDARRQAMANGAGPRLITWPPNNGQAS